MPECGRPHISTEQLLCASLRGARRFHDCMHGLRASVCRMALDPWLVPAKSVRTAASSVSDRISVVRPPACHHASIGPPRSPERDFIVASAMTRHGPRLTRALR